MAIEKFVKRFVLGLARAFAVLVISVIANASPEDFTNVQAEHLWIWGSLIFAVIVFGLK